MFRILSVCVAALTLVACAPKDDVNGDGIVDGVRDPNSVSQVAPSTPVGTISGVVVNSLNAGIEGVRVVMIVGEGAGAARSYETTTNSDGAYFFKDAPGGSNAQLLFSKTGYSNARLNGFIPGTAGNFPINDGNGNAGVITLTQLNGTLKFRVYTAQGRPAKGAKAYLEVLSTAFQTTSGVYGTAIGNFSGAADVDENGLLTFTGTPDVAEIARIGSNINYTLTIGALDEDSPPDGRADALGLIQPMQAGSLFTNPDRTFILGDARVTQTGTLSISATNLESFSATGMAPYSPPYRNAVKANDPITIVFNQPITQVDTTRLVKVVQEDCQTNVAVAVTQRAPNVLSIAPTSAWTLGNRYNIIVRATGLDTGNTVDFIGFFFAIDATAPRPLSTAASFQVRKVAPNTMSNALQPNDILNVLFDTPIINQGGPAARAIVNLDLNGDGSTGGMAGAGEFNGPAGTGFVLTNNEQLSATDPSQGTFNCKASGYSSRWSISIGTFPMSNAIPANTGMRVVFAKDQQASDTFQTAWGSPVAADVNGTINVVP
jgi:hypothetical protein